MTREELIAALAEVGQYAWDNGAPIFERMSEWAQDEGIGVCDDEMDEAFTLVYQWVRS